MIQEDKELLLKDLCARLLHGVCVEVNSGSVDGGRHTLMLCVANSTNILQNIENLDLKLYLRPMSSMTEEEKCEFNSYYNMFNNNPVGLIDWLNAHHFDYRGLIEKGLALEAPEGMYSIKDK